MGQGLSEEEKLAAAAEAARACTLCEGRLPLGARPVFRVSPTARLLIIGQAPGTKVHETGIPWNDASGERLRGWLGLDRARFYDERTIAIVPTGLCYPGRLPRGGDAPPRPECAPLWHPRLIPPMRRLGLTLLVGSHAIRARLGEKGPLAPLVLGGERAGGLWPLPHPSWRTIAWAARNPWFEAEIIPRLRARVAALLNPG